ncbi:MAG: decaprenyl-phosphate phosphoribosyltransferase [Ilumatobacter sp.]|nr:decaprenyl-phosphate phosphoribosyltransferase [bacterium]NKB39848.1 decaprenyl-phosphate phosphoribosyltransferase [Ilumatobacter sp.]
MMAPMLRALRPKQWLKNILVFAAPGAAGVLDNASDFWTTTIAFIAFCLAASGIYVWNDLNDLDSDRAHPTKRNRPFAAGLVPLGLARMMGVVLPVAALAVAGSTGRWETVAVVAAYIVLALSYTFKLKEIAIIDLLAVASGFVLRAAGGAVAVDVPMSRWFVLCVTFGSLFIVVGKRYAEFQEVGVGSGTRVTLDAYTPGFLRMLLSVSLGGALLSYCVWAFETAEGNDFPFYELSIVPMIAALFRYLLVLERGEGSAPEEVFASDRVLQLAGLVWVIIYGVAVYTA